MTEIKVHLIISNPKTGEIISRKEIEAKSWIIQFLDFIYVHFSQDASAPTDIKDLTGASKQPAAFAANFDATAEAAVTNQGIVVGTGTTAVALTDYALETQIAEGSGSGQLNHAVQAFTQPTTVGSTRKFTMARTYTNNSGADITVNEVALYTLGRLSGATGTMCVEHTLNTFTIPDTESRTVTYEVSITV